MTREQMDALVDGHYRAEETGDIDAIVDGFVAGAEHDVAGRPGDRLHGTAVGRVFGLEGRGREVHVRLLHVFDFADGLISRESAWLDVAGLQAQLSAS